MQQCWTLQHFFFRDRIQRVCFSVCVVLLFAWRHPPRGGWNCGQRVTEEANSAAQNSPNEGGAWCWWTRTQCGGAGSQNEQNDAWCACGALNVNGVREKLLLTEFLAHIGKGREESTSVCVSVRERSERRRRRQKNLRQHVSCRSSLLRRGSFLCSVLRAIHFEALGRSHCSEDYDEDLRRKIANVRKVKRKKEGHQRSWTDKKVHERIYEVWGVFFKEVAVDLWQSWDKRDQDSKLRRSEKKDSNYRIFFCFGWSLDRYLGGSSKGKERKCQKNFINLNKFGGNAKTKPFKKKLRGLRGIVVQYTNTHVWRRRQV